MVTVEIIETTSLPFPRPDMARPPQQKPRAKKQFVGSTLILVTHLQQIPTYKVIEDDLFSTHSPINVLTHFQGKVVATKKEPEEAYIIH